MARLGAYKVNDKKKETERPKFRRITDDSVEDDYEHNVWRAIEDIWVEMYATFGMPPEEIRERVTFLVDAYIQFIERETEKYLHRMSPKKKKEYR